MTRLGIVVFDRLGKVTMHEHRKKRSKYTTITSITQSSDILTFCNYTAQVIEIPDETRRGEMGQPTAVGRVCGAALGG